MKTIIIVGRIAAGKTFLANALKEHYKRNNMKVMRVDDGDIFTAISLEAKGKREGVDILLVELLELGHMARAFRSTGSLYRIINIK